MPPAAMRQFDLDGSIPFDFEMIAPPADLADLVNTYFKAGTDEARLEEIMPAYSAQLMIYMQGKSEMTGEDGEAMMSDTVTCTAPLMNAMPFTFHGPVRIVGASLTPLGWQCLANLPADKVNNCLVDPSGLFDAEELSLLEECANGDSEEAGPDQILDCVSSALRAGRGQLKPAHIAFVKTVIGWLSSALNPPLEELYSQLDQSERTAQRLCRRFFGVSPSHLLKRYRAIRAAMLLANPNLSQSMRDEIVAAYFDQAHLIHDIRRYTGRTPRALKTGSVLQDTLDPQAHGEAARILR